MDSNESANKMRVCFVVVVNGGKAPITADNITKLVKAAGAEVEPYWPKLFAQILEGQDVTKLLLSSGGGT
jgi:large subunit ribosomal protein LP1